MPRNTLGDMHNLLMEQMERLAQADSDDLDNEVKRTSSMADMAAAIASNTSNIIRLAKLRDEVSNNATAMLAGGTD